MPRINYTYKTILRQCEICFKAQTWAFTWFSQNPDGGDAQRVHELMERMDFFQLITRPAVLSVRRRGDMFCGLR
jgi:hypothetical protein